MRDVSVEVARFKWLVVSAVIFLISACVSWGELVFLVFSRTTQAEVTRVYQVTLYGRGGSERRMTRVEYAFTEPDGTKRDGYDTVPTDWEVPAAGPVSVRYTPGADGSTRLAGHVNWLPVGVVVVSLGAMAVFVAILWREAIQANREWERRKRW